MNHRKIDWEEIIARRDELLGRELEFERLGTDKVGMFRGVIKSVSAFPNSFVIELKSVANMTGVVERKENWEAIPLDKDDSQLKITIMQSGVDLLRWKDDSISFTPQGLGASANAHLTYVVSSLRRLPDSYHT